MPDISISQSFLTELKSALDDALCGKMKKVVKVRAELERMLNENAINSKQSCVNIHEELEKAIRLANGLHSHLNKLKLVA